MAARAPAGRLVSQGNDGAASRRERLLTTVLPCSREPRASPRRSQESFSRDSGEASMHSYLPLPPAPPGEHASLPQCLAVTDGGQRDAVTVTCEEAAGVGAAHRVCSRVIRGHSAHCCACINLPAADGKRPPTRSSARGQTVAA